MLLLTGEFDLTIDDKNRLGIPARVREQYNDQKFGSGFYQVLGANQILSLYPDKYYKHVVLVVAPRMVAPDESLAMDRVNYSLAGRVELDRQGRVLLSDKLLKRAKLKEQVTLIGVRDHLEVWDQKVWSEYLEQNIGNQEKLLLQAREEMFRLQQQSEMESLGRLISDGDTVLPSE
jgi:MraZ protein